MNDRDFLTYLTASSYFSIRFAEQFVKNKFTYNFIYSLALNKSCEDLKTKEFDYYPEDDGKTYDHITAEQVLSLLVRKGKVPAWIDIQVKSCTHEATELFLRCSGRYTDRKEKMMYNDRGTGPFGIKSPDFPIWWREGDPKFKLGDTQNIFLGRWRKRFFGS